MTFIATSLSCYLVVLTKLMPYLHVHSIIISMHVLYFFSMIWFDSCHDFFLHIYDLNYCWCELRGSHYEFIHIHSYMEPLWPHIWGCLGRIWWRLMILYAAFLKFLSLLLILFRIVLCFACVLDRFSNAINCVCNNLWDLVS